FTVSVRASSSCGDGAWSPSLSATLFESPEEFFLTGGGGYCEGEAGRELYLDGSEVGVDYELFFAGTTTGMVVAGDGDSISFGFHTDQGLYTASGFTTTCTSNMDGQPFIFIQPVPGQPGAVEGPQNVCNNGISQYTTTGSDDADTLVWSVEPADAGVLFPGDLMVEVDWDDAFSGNATLSYYGSNDCGNSDTAFLEITVSDTPAPEVSGPELVCEGDLAEYQAEENAGSYYSWDVTGGSITSGAGTHMITVEWGSPGTGFVTVTEDNGACQGNSAEFAVSIDDCVGIDEFEMQEAIVYPNPAGSSLNIALPGQEHVYLRIVSMIGHMVMETEQVDMTGGETRLNVEALEDGVYFIHIVNMEGNSWVGKFIKAE
ncbi:MAG TPA: T9SS type A sorting domain-containing protein, partial [Bacteroidales bacterium]|nr:T9SS type A sorting domain-containing protein [Bacteroidales bacterium]